MPSKSTSVALQDDQSTSGAVQAAQQQVTTDDPYGLQDIIVALEQSALPEGKKIGYLYMIASGSFSLQDLQQIEAELASLHQQEQAQLAEKQATVSRLEDEVDQLDQQLDDLAVATAEYMLYGVDQLMHAASEHMESLHQSEKEAEIQALKTKLSS